MKTIQQEIYELTEDVRHLRYTLTSPRTCPRVALEAEEKYRIALAKLAELQEKTTTAAQP